MIYRFRRMLAAAAVAVLGWNAASFAGTAITYQGQLKYQGGPADGSFSMTFALFDAATLGGQVGTTLVFDGLGGNPPPVSVADGLFTVELDFGAAAYNGQPRWLQITVDGTPLSPRQELTPAPHALWAQASESAATANSAATVPWSGITDVPANVSGAFSPWTTVANGTAVGWGANGWGQTDVPAGTYTAVAGGQYHSLALRSAGTLVGWGNNMQGQTDVPAGTVSAGAAKLSDAVAIATDGTWAGGGQNNYGQSTVSSGVFVAVAAGWYHSLAVRSDRTLAGWGNNDFGQTDAPEGTYIAVAAGAFHSLAIRSDGALV